MNKIQQDAYFRKRVIKEAEKSDNVKATAEKFHISRTSIYRWKKRYDGTIESLTEKSHRPLSHPNQQNEEELRMITKVWSHNKSLGLVCLHMVLTDRHNYTRCVSTLNRTMKKLGIRRKKQRRKKYVPKPYDTPKTAGERVQIDVKFVPSERPAPGAPKLYQYTAVDECTRLRFRYIFDEHSSYNAALFLKMARKYYPFEVQCVQTDNGSEFTNAMISDKLPVLELYCKRENIEHKRIRVATPRHNGKVERVHRIDQERFYNGKKFYSLEDANMQLKRYLYKDNRFPLIVLDKKSPPRFWKSLPA